MATLHDWCVNELLGNCTLCVCAMVGLPNPERDGFKGKTGLLETSSPKINLYIKFKQKLLPAIKSK